MEYQLHPLCTFFPRMDEVSFAALVADIKANGLNHPITLLDGMILDGGNRYKACIEAGVMPRFVKYDGNDPVRFVLSENLERRHLDAGQRAAIVATVTNWANAAKQGNATGNNQYQKVESGTNTNFQKTADRAKESGVSEKTQRKADAVAKANPELAKQVAQGEVSLNEATKQVAPQLLGKKQPEPQPEEELEEGLVNEADIAEIFDNQEKRIAELESIVASLTKEDTGKEIYDLKSRVRNEEEQKLNQMSLLNKKSNENDAMYRVIVQAAKFHGIDHTQSIFTLCKALLPCFKKVA